MLEFNLHYEGWKLVYVFFYIWVFYLHVQLHPRRGHWILWDYIIDCCEPLCGCWELNLCPLTEPALFLTLFFEMESPIGLEHDIWGGHKYAGCPVSLGDLPDSAPSVLRLQAWVTNPNFSRGLWDLLRSSSHLENTLSDWTSSPFPGTECMEH